MEAGGGPQVAGPYPAPMQPPWPGQPGMQQPYPAPAVGRPDSGSPVGAFFLGFLASFVVAALYTAVNAATLDELSYTMVNTLLIGHALLNGAIVGWVVGLVGRRSTGAHISGAVVAVLGAFFGFTNSVPVLRAGYGDFQAVVDMVKFAPFFPAKVWWGADATGHFLSILSLLVAAGAAWGVAHAVGRKRR